MINCSLHLEYIKFIHDDVILLHKQYATIKTALDQSHSILPAQPPSLVPTYIAGKIQPQKVDVIGKHHTRFSKPAFLSEEDENTLFIACSCEGKSATKACPCKYHRFCYDRCKCTETKCENSDS